jgi:hypothetical protein
MCKTCYLSLITRLNPGGGERVRTDGLLRARQALSQLSYTPEFLVGLDGLEPSTSRLSVVCSSQLSYKPVRFMVSALAPSIGLLVTANHVSLLTVKNEKPRNSRGLGLSKLNSRLPVGLT